MVNPYSVKPAGDVKIRSYWTDTVLGRGPFLMDQGQSSGSYTPTANLIIGNPIIITDSITSATTSIYTLVFVVGSTIPANGFIQIVLPPPTQIIIINDILLAGGSCAPN